jgi:hypothetical protein
MELTFKFHGELIEFVPERDEDNTLRISITAEDSVYTIIERFSIPREKINLVLVIGVRVRHDECECYRFSEGDILAVWPVNT